MTSMAMRFKMLVSLRRRPAGLTAGGFGQRDRKISKLRYAKCRATLHGCFA